MRQLFSQYVATKDLQIRERLILLHLGMAKSIARKFADRGVPLESLCSIGTIALIHAVDRYHPSENGSFKTFAFSTIQGEIKHHFRDIRWHVKPSRRLQDLYPKVHKTVAMLEQKLMRSPTMPEIAQELGTSEEEIIEVLEAGNGYQPFSLDAKVRDDRDA